MLIGSLYFTSRCYFTHFSYDQCPKRGNKYILVYREPCAAAYSCFKFFEGWWYEPGEIALEDFVRDLWRLLIKPLNLKWRYVSYFEHLASWWKHRNDPNVLVVFYEEMIADLESAVRAVASFIGVESEENIKAAVKMSRFDFMKANHEKFQLNLLHKHRSEALWLSDRDHAPHRVATG